MKIFISFFIFSLFLLNCQNSSASKGYIVNFTNAAAKVVWLQDKKGGTDSLAHSEELTVWGLDSQDDKGERKLIEQKANWFKPLFTPDGKRVIVSNRKKREIYQIDWQSGRVNKIGSGVAVAIWKEPSPKNFFLKKKTWLYFFDGDQPENNYFTTQPLYRMRLDKPQKRELVWNKSSIAWSSIGISRDGKIVGGLFPWPNGGIIPLRFGGSKKNEEFHFLGKGCWTSLAPDNSYLFWIFDGSHRNLQFFNTKNGEKWLTRINGIPGNIDNFEVYHPIWSNDVRFFTITGFYEKGEGGNRIGGGGDNVEVYIGKFSSNMRSVTKWFQVTHNNKPDYYPVLWVQNGEQQSLKLTKDNTQKNKDITSLKETKLLEKKQNIIFKWENSKAANQLSTQSAIGYYQAQMKLRGKALYTANLAINLTDGFVETGDAGEKIIQAILSNKNLTIEASVTPATEAEHGRIIQLTNLLNILQHGKDIVITTNAQKQREQVIWKQVFTGNKTAIITICINGNETELFINGENKGKRKIPISFQDSPVVLTFGDNKWSGKIAEIFFYNTLLTKQEIIANTKRVEQKNAKYKEPEKVKIIAVLDETTEIPAPKALGAYRRALVVNTYKVNKVLSGQYPNKKIVVTEWAVLDRKVIKQYSVKPQPEEFSVQKFSAHPELEGERQMIDVFEPDLEMWYRLPELK